AARVEGEMNRVIAASRLAADHAQVPALAIDRVGRDLAAIAVHGIEEPAGRIDGQERWVLQPAEQLHVLEPAGAAVDAIDVDALAPVVSLRRGVAADIGEQAHRWAPKTTARPGRRSSSRSDRPCKVAIALISARPSPLP